MKGKECKPARSHTAKMMRGRFGKDRGAKAPETEWQDKKMPAKKRKKKKAEEKHEAEENEEE